MICPVCKNDMIVIEHQNIELDYCTSCKGVWFDSGELDLLLKSRGLEEARSLIDGILHSQEATTSEKKRKCPICGHKMKKATIRNKNQILIDVCDEEHGLWFDGGEVAELMKHLPSKDVAKEDFKEQVIDFLEEVFKAPD